MQIVSIEIVCIKCQTCFLGKIRKSISICSLLKILPRVLCVKITDFGSWFCILKVKRIRAFAFSFQVILIFFFLFINFIYFHVMDHLSQFAFKLFFNIQNTG